MKRFLFFPVLSFFIASFIVVETAAAERSKVIIQGGDLGSVAEAIAEGGGDVVNKLGFINALVANVPTQALKGLSKRFPGIAISPDHEINLIKPFKGKPSGSGKGGTEPPPAQRTPWSLNNGATGGLDAHGYSRGSGVTVCVVDSGIDKDHPDLAANIVGGENFVVEKGVIDSSNWGKDPNGHGTHAAGTIAALDNNIGSLGIAPEASIFAVRVLDRRGSGSDSTVIAGIGACIDNNASIINMSLGRSGSPNLTIDPLRDAIQAAKDAGIKVVVAAGNEGENLSGYVPAGYAMTISVSAVGVSLDGIAFSTDAFVTGFDLMNLYAPTFNNFGLTSTDYAAPGVYVYSTYKNGGYEILSGTSMASPFVAGVMALKMSVGKTSLESLVLPNLNSSQQGAGLIDALGTVE